MKDPVAEIKNFLSDKSKIPVDQLSESTQMLSSGIIRSLVVLELIAHLEKSFGIEIGEDDLNAENFKDIRTLGALVNRVITESRSAAAL